jgi:hypothetical protein
LQTLRNGSGTNLACWQKIFRSMKFLFSLKSDDVLKKSKTKGKKTNVLRKV